jgi:flagellar biosynthesis protein FlhB
MEESQHDRTQPATPFKLEESRKRGEVARSTDFNTFALVATLVILLVGGGASAWVSLCRTTRILFAAAGTADLRGSLVEFGHGWLSVTLPFGLAGVGAAIFANLIQTGPVFSFEPLTPKFDRINPISGCKRFFSHRVLIEAVKSVLKLILLGAVVYTFFSALWPALLAMTGISADGELRYVADYGTGLLVRLGATLLVIGLLDWGLARMQFGRRMRMSRREMKDEVRRHEGDPHIRARIRELQRENLKQSRSLGRIPDADVLITNPDHVAVALRYVRGEMSAPHIIAKGGGMWVERMKAVARLRGVPILERRPLARHLYKYGAIDRPIPTDSYVDVARLYADVAADRRARQARYEISR